MKTLKEKIEDAAEEYGQDGRDIVHEAVQTELLSEIDFKAGASWMEKELRDNLATDKANHAECVDKLESALETAKGALEEIEDHNYINTETMGLILIARATLAEIEKVKK